MDIISLFISFEVFYSLILSKGFIHVDHFYVTSWERWCNVEGRWWMWLWIEHKWDFFNGTLSKYIPHQFVEKHTSAEAARKWDAHSRDRQETMRGRRVWVCVLCMWERHSEGHEEDRGAQQLQSISPLSAHIAFLHDHLELWFRHNTHKGCWRLPCVLSQMSETIPIFIPLPNLHTKADMTEQLTGENVWVVT